MNRRTAGGADIGRPPMLALCRLRRGAGATDSSPAGAEHWPSAPHIADPLRCPGVDGRPRRPSGEPGPADGGRDNPRALAAPLLRLAPWYRRKRVSAWFAVDLA